MFYFSIVPGLQNHTTGIYGILEKNTSRSTSVYFICFQLTFFVLGLNVIFRNIQRL